MRILLFLIGLLYGAIINSVLLGLAYGIYAAGLTLIGIGEVCCGRGNNGCLLSGGGEAAMAILAVIGIICLAAAALGFVGGVFYGLFAGAWHCGMDFHNNGLCRGLSSPFRFLSARWSNDINHDPSKLKEYYDSTDIHFVKKRAAATRVAVEKRVEAIHEILDTNQKAQGEIFPKRVSQIIAGYTLTPDEIEVPIPLDRFVADIIEGKDSTVVCLTIEETSKIIEEHGFFSESKNTPPKKQAVGHDVDPSSFEKADKIPPGKSKSRRIQ